MLSMYKNSSGETVVDITGCNTMLEVKVLKMSNLGLTDFDMQLFSQLINIEEMDISRNLLDLIPDSIHLPKLKHFDFSYNKLSDLQFVQHFPSLETINTVGNPVAFADFCIASFLCPSLRLINKQKINILALTKKIDNRAKPLISKVWNDHVRHLFSNVTNDAEFEILADKFRLLLKHSALSSTKPVSKFQDFRVSRLVEEFLRQVRGSNSSSMPEVQLRCPESMKRQYGKGSTVPSVEEEQRSLDDVPVEDIASEETVAIEESQEEQSECENTRTSLEDDIVEVKETVEDVMDEVESVDAGGTKMTEGEMELDSAVPKSSCGAEQRQCTLTTVDSNSQQLQVDKSGVEDKSKVVRYWMYDGPKPKSLLTTSAGDNNNQEQSSSAKNNLENVIVGGKRKRIVTPPLIKIPVIDARQAAMVVCKINSEPMVVYRGRNKKTTNSYLSGTSSRSVTTKTSSGESNKSGDSALDMSVYDFGEENKSSDGFRTMTTNNTSSQEQKSSSIDDKDFVTRTGFDKCPSKKRRVHFDNEILVGNREF